MALDFVGLLVVVAVLAARCHTGKGALLVAVIALLVGSFVAWLLMKLLLVLSIVLTHAIVGPVLGLAKLCRARHFADQTSRFLGSVRLHASELWQQTSPSKSAKEQVARRRRWFFVIWH